MIPKTQHFNPLFGKKLISFVVSRPLVRKTVPAAVEFDGEPCRGAVEIEEVDTGGILASEFEFIEAAATE